MDLEIYVSQKIKLVLMAIKMMEEIMFNVFFTANLVIKDLKIMDLGIFVFHKAMIVHQVTRMMVEKL